MFLTGITESAFWPSWYLVGVGGHHPGLILDGAGFYGVYLNWLASCHSGRALQKQMGISLYPFPFETLLTKKIKYPSFKHQLSSIN